MDDFTGNVGDVSGGLTPAGAPDARAGVAERMTLREWLVDGLRFAMRPDFQAQPMAWGRTAMTVLAVVFALDVALDALVSVWLGAWDEGAGFLPAPIKQDLSPAEDLFTALLIAPLLEEPLFRGWMRGQAASLRFAIFGFAALSLFAASLLVSPYFATPLALAGVALVFVGLIRWSRTRHYDTAVPAWFARHFRWLVWGASVIFGLIHLGNYEPLSHPLGVLVVLPQTIGGLLLAYTRTRLGLRAAVLHHAAYNALFLVSDYGWW